MITLRVGVTCHDKIRSIHSCSFPTKKEDMETKKQPTQAMREEATRHPNGYIYEIADGYDPNGAVPREAIIGAWKIDAEANIVGDFIPNPTFKPPEQRGKVH